jgi:hypothetical protein
MRQAHFRHGLSTFPCAICQRLTRESGQAIGCGLCFECYELAGIDNTVNDNGPHLLPEYQSEITALVAKAVKHGGNADRIRSQFRFLFPKALP